MATADKKEILRSKIDATTKNNYIHLYKQLLWLRSSEETLVKLYREQEMRTPTHFGTGQEAVAVGVCEALSKDDVVYSHHRCHNHYLARGGDLYKLATELYGREDGCSKGRGGSVHLTARDKNFIISSAILAQTMPVATGSALVFKMNKQKNVAVCFFGEAACEEGAFYESMNYASVHKLPVLFVCENNLYSTESPLETRQPPATELCERARSFKIDAKKIDGNDVFTVYNEAKNMLADIRNNQGNNQNQGPKFLECMTYRWREHVGPYFDYELNRTYRTKEELELWMQKCPLKNAEKFLIKEEIISKDDISIWQSEIDEKIQKIVGLAKEASWPLVSELFENVY